MDKIKIYVTARIADILLKDAEGFEFFKADGRTVNKNALLTALIINYHAEFAARQAEIADFVKRRLAGAGLGEGRLAGVCADICGMLNERSAAPAGEKFDRLISLKPTKLSDSVIEYIEKYELGGRTLSEYFRSMLAGYCALPQDMREKIIFREQYETIMQAIARRRKVFLVRNPRGNAPAKNRRSEISPYAVSRSKEELHLYVTGVHEGNCVPIRLSRIASAKMLPEEAAFTQEQTATLEKMIKYGPQFAYRPGEGVVAVQLSPKGEELFRKLYVHRPVPLETDGNILKFDCSHMQIVQYFERFGAAAKVLYPESLTEELYRFHRRAAKAYHPDLR